MTGKKLIVPDGFVFKVNYERDDWIIMDLRIEIF